MCGAGLAGQKEATLHATGRTLSWQQGTELPYELSRVLLVAVMKCMTFVGESAAGACCAKNPRTKLSADPAQ